MEIKDFKTLARKILDVNGFENVALRFDHSVVSGAWVLYPREETHMRYWDAVKKCMTSYFPNEVCEYSSVTFSLEFIRHGNMSEILQILFHELCHLKRGYNKSASYVGLGRYAEEMDCDHDFEWMKFMWKYGYDGKPKFDSVLSELQKKILRSEGFTTTDGWRWDPPKEGRWKDMGRPLTCISGVNS